MSDSFCFRKDQCLCCENLDLLKTKLLQARQAYFDRDIVENQLRDTISTLKSKISDLEARPNPRFIEFEIELDAENVLDYVRRIFGVPAFNNLCSFLDNNLVHNVVANPVNPLSNIVPNEEFLAPNNEENLVDFEENLVDFEEDLDNLDESGDEYMSEMNDDVDDSILTYRDYVISNLKKNGLLSKTQKVNHAEEIFMRGSQTLIMEMLMKENFNGNVEEEKKEDDVMEDDVIENLQENEMSIAIKKMIQSNFGVINNFDDGESESTNLFDIWRTSASMGFNHYERIFKVISYMHFCEILLPIQ